MWKRKVYQYRNGSKKGTHMASYISPLGFVLAKKSQVTKYFEMVKRQGITEILDVKKSYFTASSYNLKKKICNWQK